MSDTRTLPETSHGNGGSDSPPCVLAISRYSKVTFVYALEPLEWHRPIGGLVVTHAVKTRCHLNLRVVSDEEAVDVLKHRSSVQASLCEECFWDGGTVPEPDPPSRIMNRLLEAWEVEN